MNYSPQKKDLNQSVLETLSLLGNSVIYQLLEINRQVERVQYASIMVLIWNRQCGLGLVLY